MQKFPHPHAEIPPPQFGDFFSNLPLCRFTEICMQKVPPCSLEIFSEIYHSADLLKSACRNSPPSLEIFLKSATLQIYQNLHVEIPPPSLEIFSQICHSADLLKSACRNSPTPMQKFSPILEIFFSNLSLCRFTEICMQKFPLIWRFFLKSTTLQIY